MTDTQSAGIAVRTERLKRRLDELELGRAVARREHLWPVPDELDELFGELGAKANDLRRLIHERDVRLGQHLRDASAPGNPDETAARRARIKEMRAEMNEARERSESKDRPAMRLVRGGQA